MIRSLRPHTARALSAPATRSHARAVLPIALSGALLGALLAGCGATGEGGDAVAADPDASVEPVPAEEVDFTDLPVRSISGRTVVFVRGQVVREPGSGPAIVLEDRSGITLDLAALELRGQDRGADLDRAAGVGILLRRCDDVVIKGGLLGGFKVCVAVEDSTNVRIEGVRFDGWFGQRLRSTAFVEDLSDWLRPHENDAGEWVDRYGAAIAATRVEGLEIADCRGRRGQNGILLTRGSNCRLYDNDFSFLSGWGLAMYRSSDNVVSRNVFDYCVRGYSHDVYWRGQDSAGILMFEQCSRNLVAENSATHSGDGVFLYAGNALVARGERDATGSDDNIFYGNDLRFAVANGVEATFSRGNAVIRNDLSGAHQHGVWAGYSSDSIFLGNTIEGVLGPAITIEHGQDCIFAENRLTNSEIGFEAYWDEDPEFVDGPYAELRSTASRGHHVLQNTFENNVLDLVVRRSTGLVFHGNRYVPGTREPYFDSIGAESDPTLDALTVQRWLDALDGAYPSGNLSFATLNPWTGRAPELLRRWRGYALPDDLPGDNEVDASKRDEFRGGLDSIVMGEWGPWDHRSGAPRPEVRRPGGLLRDVVWDAQWFRWEKSESDPRTAERVWRSRVAAPLLSQSAPNWINPWGSDEVRRRVGNDFFGLFATTVIDVPEAGTYVLSTTSDDGVRVYIDEQLMIERWSLHAATRDERTVILEAGEHTVRLEYFQIQGAAALVVELHPAQ